MNSNMSSLGGSGSSAGYSNYGGNYGSQSSSYGSSQISSYGSQSSRRSDGGNYGSSRSGGSAGGAGGSSNAPPGTRVFVRNVSIQVEGKYDLGVEWIDLEFNSNLLVFVMFSFYKVVSVVQEQYHFQEMLDEYSQEGLFWVLNLTDVLVES